ncbi:MAG: HDOD domain-containing protein [Sterolibacterium sp.]
MSFDRREHVRYKPTAPLQTLLIWQDETGGQKSSPAQLNDLSQGGCSLISLDAPPVNEHVLAVLTLLENEVALQLQCKVLFRNPVGNALQTSLRFEQVSEEHAAHLTSALASHGFQALTDTPLTNRKHWRVPQWAAFLTAQELPVMPRSKQALLTLEEEKGSELTATDLVEVVHGDPFLCLRLLREAEKRRSARLGHETSTPLAAVMQLGVTSFRDLLFTSPEADETHSGLANCEARAVMAGKLAAAWSKSRSDMSPDEVLMAALLSEMGELLLWHFAPDLPQAALEALAAGTAKRTALAQEAACGFKFKDLTVKCAEIWKLPAILLQMIRGHDTVRANLARLSRNTARHLITGPGNPALPDDLAAAKRLLPHTNMAWLVEELPWVPAEMRQDLIDKANLALVEHPAEMP